MPEGQPEKCSELAHLGKHLYWARVASGLTQHQLARRCGFPQSTISRFEQGKAIPGLVQLVELGRALGVSLQWFLSGSNDPGQDIADLILELSWLGVADLATGAARVPGAFRPPEQVLALVVGGRRPDPRVLEAVPAVLAWNRLRVELLLAYGQEYDPRVLSRLAWLADVVLTVHRHKRFPGGCVDVRGLESFVERVPRPEAEDDLGHPAGPDEKLSPVWKRWRVMYSADLETFERRAAELLSLRSRRKVVPATAGLSATAD